MRRQILRWLGLEVAAVHGFAQGFDAIADGGSCAHHVRVLVPTCNLQRRCRQNMVWRIWGWLLLRAQEHPPQRATGSLPHHLRTRLAAALTSSAVRINLSSHSHVASSDSADLRQLSCS